MLMFAADAAERREAAVEHVEWTNREAALKLSEAELLNAGRLVEDAVKIRQGISAE